MAPPHRMSSISDRAAYLAQLEGARSKPLSLAVPLLPEEDPAAADEDPLPRAQTAPTGQPQTSAVLDRTLFEPLRAPSRRYVAYAANPFRADRYGRGTALLPPRSQAKLEETLGCRLNLALCSATREEEMLPEAEFHEVMEQVRQEVEKADGPVDSYADTFWSVVSALVVNPLILMPYYTSLNGFVVSVVIVAAVAAIAERCTESLHRCVDELARRVPMSEAPPLARDYAFVAHHALGRAGSAVAISIYTLDFWTAVVANFVIVDRLYRDWLPGLGRTGRCLPVLFHAAATCALLYVPSTIFGKTQLLAALSSLVLVVAAGLLAVPRIAAGDVDVLALLLPGTSADSIVLEVTSSIFAYGNVSILPKITSSWQARPRERDGLLRTSFAASAGIYAAFGAIGAIALRHCGPDALFTMTGPLGVLSQVGFLLRVQFCLPLLCSPCIHVMQDVLGVARMKGWRVLLALALVFASAGVAQAAGGQMDTVMSLIGACVTTSLIIVLPPLMELDLCGGRLERRSRGWLLATAGVGVLASLAGSAAAWRKLRGA